MNTWPWVSGKCMFLLYSIYAPSPSWLKEVLTLEQRDYACSHQHWQTNLHFILRRCGRRKPADSSYSSSVRNTVASVVGFCLFSSGVFILWNCRALASVLFLLVTRIIHKRLVGMQLSPSQSRAKKRLLPLVTQAKGDRFLTESISQQIRLKLTNHWGQKHPEGQNRRNIFIILPHGRMFFSPSFYMKKQSHT